MTFSRLAWRSVLLGQRRLDRPSGLLSVAAPRALHVVFLLPSEICLAPSLLRLSVQHLSNAAALRFILAIAPSCYLSLAELTSTLGAHVKSKGCCYWYMLGSCSGLPQALDT